MGIMDMFRSAPPQAQAPAVQQVVTPAGSTPPIQSQPGIQDPNTVLPGTHVSATTAPNGVVPSNNVTTQANQEPSPLDGFKDIWQTPAQQDPNKTAPLFANVDPKKLMESARQVDFSKSLNQETLQKISAGGPEAIAALMESMNSLAQNVYAQNALATTRIVDQALTKQREQIESQLPNMVRSHSATESLMANNPIYSNPAIQPLAEAAREMILRKFPNATSAEISQQVDKYFQALGQSFQPKTNTQQTTQASQGEDWGKFLGM